MIQVVYAFLGSFCAGALFSIRGKRLILSGLSGAVGWFVYSLMKYRIDQYQLIAIFAGAIAVGAFSEAAARCVKSPATIFLVPGIFPIVPGIAAYETIQLIVNGKLQQAGAKMVETFAGAAAIAFGIMLVAAVFRIAFKKKAGQGAEG
jgi:uncharacterized membrane protein YjjB (DUF3815 family)